MTACPSSFVHWGYCRTLFIIVIVIAITLSHPACSQPNSFRQSRSFRRSLVSMSLNTFFSFCWKDVVPRKPASGCSANSGAQQAATGGADVLSNDASKTSACAAGCPVGFASFGPVSKSSCGRGRGVPAAQRKASNFPES